MSSFRFFGKYSYEEKDGGTSDSHERDDEEEAGHAGTTLETRPGRELLILQHASSASSGALLMTSDV